MIGLVGSRPAPSAARGDAVASLGFKFTEIASQAGLTAVTVFGGKDQQPLPARDHGQRRGAVRLRRRRLARRLPRQRHHPRRLPQGAGADEPSLSQPRRRHVRGRHRDAPGSAASGWGQGACAGDYDNDGHEDLFVTLLRSEPPVPQPRRRHVRGRDRARAGCRQDARAGARAAPSSTTTATAASTSSSPTTSTSTSPPRPRPTSGLCRYKGVQVACGPPGLHRRQERALPQPRRRHVRGRVGASPASRAPAAPTASASARSTSTTTAGSTSTWPTTRTRARSIATTTTAPSRTSRVDRRLRLQPGRQAAGGHGRGHRRLRSQRHHGHLQDQLRGRHLDAVRRTAARASATTAPSPPASALNTRWLGWGAGFVDFDNDGWLDLFLANGHVYPEVAQLKTEAGYEQRKVVYRNLGQRPVRGRDASGSARRSTDADGRPRRGVRRRRQRRRRRHRRQQRATRAPDLFRTSTPQPDATGCSLKLVGTTSNRSAIGARVARHGRWRHAGGRKCAAAAATSRRTTFACTSGSAARRAVERLWVRWPNGLEEEWRDVAADQILTLTRGHRARKAPR